MSALLEVIKNQPIEDFGEKLIYGGQMLLIGMATIFSVLVLLWLCLVVFKLVFHGLPQKSPADKNSAKVETASAAAPAPQQATNDEIVAVIAAAIAAAESESSGLKFRVVSFRRK